MGSGIIMSSASAQRSPHRPVLSFLALLAFVISFLTARIFATNNPDRILLILGIHVHHFWYGLALLAVAGWLGIAWRSSERLDRIYAVIYGVGAGLIGDEVGLLLTFGNYQSELTFDFFIAVLAFALLAILFLQYHTLLAHEFLHPTHGQRTMLIGILTAGISPLLLFGSVSIIAVFLMVLGAVIALIGFLRQRKMRQENEKTGTPSST